MSLAYTYYPGCSLEATSVWYARSIAFAARELNVALLELDDWNCCGATAYMSVKELMSFCISARNLALAEPLKRDLVTPCNACFTVLNKTNHYFHSYPDLREKIRKALAQAGLTYGGTVRVRHILDVFVNDLGLDAIRKQVTQPLGGMKIAPYYGCQIVRPETGLDNPDYPVIFEKLLRALGAEPVDYPLRTRCCGASLVLSKPKAAVALIDDLLKSAEESGAEAIATLCPMCHINLEMQMQRVNAEFGREFHFPVLFFSQLLGVALGGGVEELGLKKGFVDPVPLCEKHGVYVSPRQEGVEV